MITKSVFFLDLFSKDGEETLKIISPGWRDDLNFYLSECNVPLTQISYKTLFNFLERNATFLQVIVSVTSLKEKIFFDEKIKKQLLSYVDKKKINVFHISSFANEEYFMYSKKRTQNYHLYPTPINTKYLLGDILSIYHSNVSTTDKWPGGRRGRLINM